MSGSEQSQAQRNISSTKKRKKGGATRQLEKNPLGIYRRKREELKITTEGESRATAATKAFRALASNALATETP
jgi:hypothetical protein